jgi:cytochrome P450
MAGQSQTRGGTVASDDVTVQSVARGNGGCPVLSGYDPMEPAELRDPDASYARARREAPVFYMEKYGFWSVSRYEDIFAIMLDTERFSNKNVVPMPLPPENIRDRMPKYPFATALVFMDNPEHDPARQLVKTPLTPNRVGAAEPLTRKRAEELLRAAGPDRRIEFVRDYALPLALVVIGNLIGVPEADFPLLEHSIVGAFRIASGAASEDELPILAEGQLSYWEYLCRLVEDRRSQPRDDFTSVLANYVHDDGSTPSTDEVAGHVNTILGAGFETSAQLMAHGVESILRHRDQWELLKSDRSLINGAVEECARYRSVIKRNFRIALTDVEIGGVKIPKGSLIAIMIACANRDERVFEDPDRFDITRTVENVAFGRGMHFCLGAPLSKLELRVTLETLLDLAPDAQIPDQDVEYSEDIRIDGMRALYVDLGPVPGDGG